ncbi:Trk system potassium uptake protein TrkA [Cystobacter fuscus DSM 2262]|uniref:Trk system potassium uptake protein TrkA n=1 Tax=Cystobacter fuscus (strain ATCC 25194 / DSM 2262 / NBRC 100088 / M29) TaxID=1242864 RepID=S9NU92_CYSF2|nr:NAD-binding protein [Cystobacter fuscus]EPX55745.1 Trk system potassium uptake protein TrkA [Cystobacter fuscus DSM 2262]
MKFLTSELTYFLRDAKARQNVRALLQLLAVLLLLVVVFTVLFHVLMKREGQEHSWLTGLYWTLTVMTTLGFGDITFHSDMGRAFSVVVLLSGVVFLLVLLPFTFIQFFYAPWMEAQRQSRAPRELPEDTRGHVILSHYDAVTMSLIPRLEFYGHPYVVLEDDVARALELHDRGVRVMVGPKDDQETYRRLRVQAASLLVATGDDFLNTNIAFTARELTEQVPIASLARKPESVDVLELAGANHVIQLPDMLGRSLARRTLAGEVRANVIGRFGQLVIAEAPVTGTPFVGKTLAETRLREVTGVNVVGMWQRGQFSLPRPDTRIESSTVLVLAGTDAQLETFDSLVVIYNVFDRPVLILGGGRVGRAVAASLREREVPYRIVEEKPENARGLEHAVVGSAADLEVLKRAGIDEAPTALVTTSNDAINIYLTIYCRRLRPDMQIISRATLERNVSTLHRAGADFVMSYASMGANAILNVLEQGDVVMLAEGLDVFRYPASAKVIGRSLRETRIREETGCSVIALEMPEQTVVNPDPSQPIPGGAELILIGTAEGERRFKERFA